MPVRPTNFLRPWLYLAAATFLAYYAVLVYSERYQPGETGLRYDFAEGTMRIRAVSPSSPASRAGIRSDDVLLAVDERQIHTWEDWRHFRATRETGRTYRFKIERPAGPVDIPVVLGHQRADPLAPLERKRYVQCGLLLFALALFFLRTQEPVRLVAAWLLASIGTAPLFPEAEMTAVWRGLPTLAGALLWIPQISHLMLLPLFFTFFALLPRPLFKARWAWVLVWSPALLVTAWASLRLYAQIYDPPLVQELPAWIRFVIGAGAIIYCGGGLIALLINYRSSVLQDRTRFRMLVVGAFVGLAPLVPFLAAIFWGTLTESSIVWFFVSDPYRHSLTGLFLFFPICLAYSVVRHNVLRHPAQRDREAGGVS